MMRVADFRSLAQVASAAAAAYGELDALSGAKPGNDDLTYAQLWRAVGRARAALARTPAAPGDRVLLAMESRPEWAVALFGVLGEGMAAVPVVADATPEAVAGVAAHTQAKLVIHSDRTRELTAGIEAATRLSLDRLLGEPDAVDTALRGAPDDLAILAHTSGSTSHPRLVELTHGNLLSNLDALLRIHGGGAGDTMMSMLPLAHMFGLMVGLLVPVACGARAVFPSAMLPNRIVDALRDNRVTHALAVPALLECLYREGLRELAEAGVIEAHRQRQSPAETAARVAEDLREDGLGGDDLDRIRAATRSRIGPAFHTVIVGGAAVDPAIVGILTALGIRVEVGYGLTEASPVVCLGSAGESPPGSVGGSLPGVDVRVDSNGEILVRGGNVMRGYFGDPEATEATIRDGWLHTGDQGRMDDSGHLFITGRLKEAMVTSAGETIYPEEIEPLYQDPLFGELCVTAIPGAHGNDVPTLFVVPATPDVPGDELRRVFSDLRAGAPPRLRIERMLLLEQPLPRTATGKVRRRVLASDFEKQAAATRTTASAFEKREVAT